MEKYILLDRDGTINIERKDYVKNWSEFIFLPCALDALKLLQKHNYRIIIITNQSAVGRGIISRKVLDGIHSKMCNELKENGVEILDIFICESHPELNDFRRKPNPGMLLEASEKYSFDLSRTYFVGDSQKDMEAGKAAGSKVFMLTTLDLFKFVTEILGLD